MKKESVFKIIFLIVVFALMYQFGVKPVLLDKNTFVDPKNSNWVDGRLDSRDGEYDLIVVGEEPEGIAAAVSASRMGAKTLLIAEGDTLGGDFPKCLLGDFEISFTAKGGLLNKGIFSELYYKMNQKVTQARFNAAVKELVNEKRLNIVFNTKIISPIVNNGLIKSINVSIQGVKRTYTGRDFIDATKSGVLLNLCGVPSFKGSEDINLTKSFIPAKLNFVVKGITKSQIKKVISPLNDKFYEQIRSYKTTSVNLRLNDLNFYQQDDGTTIIEGIEVINTDVTNPKALEAAYKDAQNEAKILTAFLKKSDEEFKGIEFVKTAEKLYVKESIHYIGENTLTVNDILDNKDAPDKIAMGSYILDAGKFASEYDYILGTPVQYGIPLGCIIPKKMDNLLMVGRKISYTSLAASSAGSISTNIATGESAGVVAVYSAVYGINPRDLLKPENKYRIIEIQQLLNNQGVYLPDFEIKNTDDNRSFGSVRELRSLGLVAGGEDNNYKYENEATESDFAMLILNGVYRLSRDKYNLELDSRIRSYFTEVKLTKEKAAEIILSLYGVAPEKDKNYEKACKLGYISQMVQAEIGARNFLMMEDIYVLAADNIKKYTGKEFPI